MYKTNSLTDSGVEYQLIGFVNGALVRPSATAAGGVEIIPAPAVAKALDNLGIPTDKPVELQYKNLDAKTLHFQWRGPAKNRKYGAAFDVPTVFGKTVAAEAKYLSEDELAY